MKDSKMYVLMVIPAILGGYAWYLQRPDLKITAIGVVVCALVMSLIWLSFQHPKIFSQLIWGIVIVLGGLSVWMIRSKNEKYSFVSWLCLSFLAFLILVSISSSNKKKKKEDSRYGLKATLWLFNGIFCYFLGKEIDYRIGIFLFFAIPVALGSSSKLLKKRKKNKEESEEEPEEETEE